MNFSLVVVGVFSGKSETEKGKNEILFYFWGFRGAAFILFCGGGGGVHWVQVVRLFGASGPAECRRWSSGRVFRCFCPLSRFVFGALALKYAFIRILRAFLEGFPCWMYVCIACVLCVVCGAFVCVSG